MPLFFFYKNGTNLFFTHVILYMATEIALYSQSRSSVKIGGIPSSEEAREVK